MKRVHLTYYEVGMTTNKWVFSPSNWSMLTFFELKRQPDSSGLSFWGRRWGCMFMATFHPPHTVNLHSDTRTTCGFVWLHRVLVINKIPKRQRCCYLVWIYMANFHLFICRHQISFKNNPQKYNSDVIDPAKASWIFLWEAKSHWIHQLMIDLFL